MLTVLQKQKIAILYQALAPPLLNGQRKEAKPGGYSDSGADIAFCLRGAGFHVLTPVPSPNPARATDWVFPDTQQGLRAARKRGATVLWANTVLFEGHPLEEVLGDVWVVGQSPHLTQAADDKFKINALLRGEGLPVAASIEAFSKASSERVGLDGICASDLTDRGLRFPLIVKPVRGRGSQGVVLVDTFERLQRAATDLVSSGRFGDGVIIEQYLAGDELTVTVMPRGVANRGPWTLPAVRRFNHNAGVAPYNGAVAVTANSKALSVAEQAHPSVRAMQSACVKAALIVGARAPIRIDCRSDEQGVFRLFDLNMKPNMTSAGRPGRDDQDGLSTLAAAALGWTYADLLQTMLADAWQERSGVLTWLSEAKT